MLKLSQVVGYIAPTVLTDDESPSPYSMGKFRIIYIDAWSRQDILVKFDQNINLLENVHR